MSGFNKIAKSLIEENNPPVIFAFEGELGAGKTTFTQICAKFLNVKGNVNSPTFIIHTEYKIENSVWQLHHLDFYRIDNESELNELRLGDFIDSGYVFIEWADKFEDEIRRIADEKNVKLIWLIFKIVDENTREITIN